MTLPYTVSIKYIKVDFSQNVLYHIKEITKKYFSWVFTERVTYVHRFELYLALNKCVLKV